MSKLTTYRTPGYDDEPPRSPQLSTDDDDDTDMLPRDLDDSFAVMEASRIPKPDRNSIPNHVGEVTALKPSILHCWPLLFGPVLYLAGAGFGVSKLVKAGWIDPEYGNATYAQYREDSVIGESCRGVDHAVPWRELKRKLKRCRLGLDAVQRPDEPRYLLSWDEFPYAWDPPQPDNANYMGCIRYTEGEDGWHRCYEPRISNLVDFVNVMFYNINGGEAVYRAVIEDTLPNKAAAVIPKDKIVVGACCGMGCVTLQPPGQEVFNAGNGSAYYKGTMLWSSTIDILYENSSSTNRMGRAGNYGVKMPFRSSYGVATLVKTYEVDPTYLNMTFAEFREEQVLGEQCRAVDHAVPWKELQRKIRGCRRFEYYDPMHNDCQACPAHQPTDKVFAVFWETQSNCQHLVGNPNIRFVTHVMWSFSTLRADGSVEQNLQYWDDKHIKNCIAQLRMYNPFHDLMAKHLPERVLPAIKDPNKIVLGVCTGQGCVLPQPEGQDVMNAGNGSAYYGGTTHADSCCL
ncbi:hypothetical protein DYB31_010925 [Aphanomyces astaci]|uniref:GH18 domain-containing protein n=1 Tax=Aphanomyces astaci TaxID=112090 RepID=A0A397F0T7_APHAT|nr:hypothetical protein DYB31_010925 [Aphanomyces astaci]